MNRIEGTLGLTRKKLDHAKEFFEKNDMEETIHYIWVVFENCINIIKDLKNKTPVYKHKPKIELYSIYYSLGILKKDYSEVFAKLEKLRIRADFCDYSRVPNLPGRQKIEEFLDNAIELFEEVANMVKTAKTQNINKRED